MVVSRVIIGGVLTFLGVAISLIPVFVGFKEGSFVAWIYGIPILIFGIIIIFNDKEDKIEQVKKMKGGIKK